MQDILRYVQELSSRSKLKKVFYKTQDATAVRSLDNELVHAFHLFTVCALYRSAARKAERSFRYKAA